MKNYEDFLRAKVKLAESWGYDVAESEINPQLKPHQRAMVKWAVAGGRRACFAAFGLGKSVVQLETVRLTLTRCGGRGLIVCPLGVRQEFIRDARQVLGWETPPKFIRTIAEALADGIYLTNYESIREGKIDPAEFAVVSLDEASILRGFGGTKTFRELMRLCTGDGGPSGIHRTDGKRVAHRFVATATPSPNEYIELLAYAEFLGIMDISQAKTRFFKRDSTKADCLTLHPHKEREFWLWVASWALFVQLPSDLGFSDEGYALPEMTVNWHEVATDHHDAGHERSGQAKLFRDAAIGVQDAAAEKRRSMGIRIAKLISIIHDERAKEGVVPGMVPEEQGGASGEAAREGTQKLPRKSRALSRTEPEMEEGESGALSRAPEGAPREEPRNVESQVCGVVSHAQSQRLASIQSGKASHIRTDAGAIRRDGESDERRVPNLPTANRETSCGSLPQVREDARIALPKVQCRDRFARGESGEPEKSCRVSDQLVIWCDLNDEQRAIESALNDVGISYSSLTGTQEIDEREHLLEQWRRRDTCAFVSKPTMYGAGINLQQSHTMIFAGIGFKFCDLIQAIHRIHRFLQQHPCTIHLIYTEAEREVRKQLERKWSQHNSMVEKMTSIIREFGLSQAAMAHSLTRKLGIERVEVSGPGYRLINNDCVLEAKRMETDSVGLVLTSIPFSTQYEYSPNYADFGHSEGNDQFFQQMDYLTPELLRVLKPGRIAAVHVKDRIVPGGMTGLGFQTVYPFHLHTIAHYMRHGFGYMGMVTIVTDVVRENNQTYRLGWTEQCKDGTKMGVGMPEYLLLFRKPPTDSAKSYADDPVLKSKERYTRSRWQVDAHAFWRSSGDRLLRPEELRDLPHDAIFQIFRKYSLDRVYSFEHHVALAEGLEHDGRLPVTFMLLQPQSWHDEVWTDITRMLTLNSSQAQKGQQMHLCPMQFDLADRVIERFSNKGDVVFDPFSGLGTVAYRSILKGRCGVGVELSPQYFCDSASYCKSASDSIAMPTLFSLDDVCDEQAQYHSGAQTRVAVESSPQGSPGNHSSNRGPYGERQALAGGSHE